MPTQQPSRSPLEEQDGNNASLLDEDRDRIERVLSGGVITKTRRTTTIQTPTPTPTLTTSADTNGGVLLCDDEQRRGGLSFLSLFCCGRKDNENENENNDPPNDAHANNVTLVLLYTWVAFTGRGLWNQNCLATLVFLLRNGDPKAIGFVTAAMGLSQLCASIPTGILADRYQRDVLLKTGAVVGIAAATTSIVASSVETNNPSYALLVSALVLWGIHWGITNTAITAFFADSIPDGERSLYFTKRAILINVANMCGPTIALLMFAWMGDNWTVRDCSMVLLAGNVLSLPGIFLLCWMKDNNNSNNGNNTDVNRHTDNRTQHKPNNM